MQTAFCLLMKYIQRLRTNFQYSETPLLANPNQEELYLLIL